VTGGPSAHIRPGTSYDGDHAAGHDLDETSGLPPGWPVTDAGYLSLPPRVQAAAEAGVLPGGDIGEHGRDAGAGPHPEP
jgi:hypothetical protein